MLVRNSSSLSIYNLLSASVTAVLIARFVLDLRQVSRSSEFHTTVLDGFSHFDAPELYMSAIPRRQLSAIQFDDEMGVDQALSQDDFLSTIQLDVFYSEDPVRHSTESQASQINSTA
jgi:hypothetical protein